MLKEEDYSLKSVEWEKVVLANNASYEYDHPILLVSNLSTSGWV